MKDQEERWGEGDEKKVGDNDAKGSNHITKIVIITMIPIAAQMRVRHSRI